MRTFFSKRTGRRSDRKVFRVSRRQGWRFKRWNGTLAISSFLPAISLNYARQTFLVLRLCLLSGQRGKFTVVELNWIALMIRSSFFSLSGYELLCRRRHLVSLCRLEPDVFAWLPHISPTSIRTETKPNCFRNTKVVAVDFCSYSLTKCFVIFVHLPGWQSTRLNFYSNVKMLSIK